MKFRQIINIFSDVEVHFFPDSCEAHQILPKKKMHMQSVCKALLTLYLFPGKRHEDLDSKQDTYIHGEPYTDFDGKRHRATGWQRLIGSFKLQIILHKRATKYRALLRKMTYKDKGSCESSPPCRTETYIQEKTCIRSSISLSWKETPRDVHSWRALCRL